MGSKNSNSPSSPREGRVLPQRIAYPEALPVAERRKEIAAALAENQVIIVAGETGSGKTTQLPKICLELGRGSVQRIGHTQPRRLAARTVAQRIAEELSVPLGGLVGYQVRFHDSVSDASAVKLMTDGILLSELSRDRDLSQYDTLIIDEAHERSLNIDFILGYLKRLLPRRPDLKVIVTSATIDEARFAEFFGDAPIIRVSGRTYPVETHYLLAEGETNEEPLSLVEEAVNSVRSGHWGEPGDMLVFLSGERDIRDLHRRLRSSQDLDVLPLYARLSQAEQARVFGRGPRRGLRVVLATNVAETSVTVPGIRYVIDPGDARISRFSYRTRVQRLPIEPISRASADQRRGRCGRVGPGVCLRLYSEADYNARPQYTDPEIKRSNLAAVVLQMLQLGLGKIERFPFIEAPDRRLVRDGFRLLQELGALDDRERLTRLGRRMAAFPVDPSLARMLLAAEREGVLAELLVIASALAIQDPRERPADRQQQADQSHARFRHPRSDFLSLLNLWNYYEDQRQSLSENRLRRLCKREFLSYLRMREWRDMHRQLSIACRRQGLRPSVTLAEEADYAAIHRALLAGLLANIAQQEERRDYRGAQNRLLSLFPGSSLWKKPPKWILAAEVVETQRVYARMAAAIEPQWVLPVNPKLLKHQYHEPTWDKGKGRVTALRRTTLFGLTVSDRVPVHYGRIDPALSRELMLREGFIPGRWPGRLPAFLKHNLKLQREVADLESRIRRRDLLIDDEQLFSFYDERVPAELVNAEGVKAWLAEDSARDKALCLRRADLLTRDPGDALEQFPDHLQWEGQRYRLRYEFSPGGEADGVSIDVPVALLNRLPRFRLEWLVPGMLREKCIHLLRGLPKHQRKKLVPVPDWADRALANISPDDRPLTQALGESLAGVGGPKLDAGDWQPETLDDYYRMNVRVLDERGRLLAQGRDPEVLVAQFREETREQLESGGQGSPAQQGLTRWPDEELPRQFRFRQAGAEVIAFPALADTGESVDVVLHDYPGQALIAHRQGLARLLMLGEKPLQRQLSKQTLRDNASALMLAATGLERESLVTDMLCGVFLTAAGLQQGNCYTEAEFRAAKSRCRQEAQAVANEYAALLYGSLEAQAEARHLAQGHGDLFAEGARDISEHGKQLLATGKLAELPLDALRHFPRYSKAQRVRAERLTANYKRDREQQARLEQLRGPLREVLADCPGALMLSPSALRYWAMLEEFAVSLFAQHLGTAQPVSEKRLLAQWSAVEAWWSRTRGQSAEESRGPSDGAR